MIYRESQMQYIRRFSGWDSRSEICYTVYTHNTLLHIVLQYGLMVVSGFFLDDQ